MSRYKYSSENEKRNEKEMILDVKRYLKNGEMHQLTNNWNKCIISRFCYQQWVALNSDNINYHAHNITLIINLFE